MGLENNLVKERIIMMRALEKVRGSIKAKN
jgi:hypothetical protein